MVYEHQTLYIKRFKGKKNKHVFSISAFYINSGTRRNIVVISILLIISRHVIARTRVITCKAPSIK